MHTEQVKKYVLSSLICAVVMLHSLAMSALGATGADKGGARQGLFVIAILLGLVAIGAVRLVNRLTLATPWLLVAPVIPLVVYYIVLWR